MPVNSTSIVLRFEVREIYDDDCLRSKVTALRSNVRSLVTCRIKQKRRKKETMEVSKIPKTQS